MWNIFHQLMITLGFQSSVILSAENSAMKQTRSNLNLHFLAYSIALSPKTAIILHTYFKDAWFLKRKNNIPFKNCQWNHCFLFHFLSAIVHCKASNCIKLGSQIFFCIMITRWSRKIETVFIIFELLCEKDRKRIWKKYFWNWTKW